MPARRGDHGAADHICSRSLPHKLQHCITARVKGFLTEFGVNCFLADNWICRWASAMAEVTGHCLMGDGALLESSRIPSN